MAEKNPAANRFGGPWLAILFTLVIFVASQFIALGITYAALHFLHHTTISGDITGLSVPYQFLYTALAELLALGLTLSVVVSFGLKFASIGLGRSPNRSDVGKGLLGFAAFFGGLIVINLVLGLIWPSLNGEKQDVGFSVLHNPSDHVLAFLALVIIPPLGEETLVRGYLYSALRSHWRFVPAMLVTSVLFGVAHLDTGSAGALWSAGIDTFVLSLVLVYLREKTGSLYASYIVHMLNNLVAFFFLT